MDQECNVLDILVQSRRNQAAARKFFRLLLKDPAHEPRVNITDKRASYGVARRAVLPRVEPRQHKRLHKRAEHAHQPTRERERRLRRFQRPGHAQRFLAADASPPGGPGLSNASSPDFAQGYAPERPIYVTEIGVNRYNNVYAPDWEVAANILLAGAERILNHRVAPYPGAENQPEGNGRNGRVRGYAIFTEDANPVGCAGPAVYAFDMYYNGSQCVSTGNYSGSNCIGAR